MAWNLTVYSNTGLTTANTIGDVHILANAAHDNLPAPDIVSPARLKDIKVRATRSQVDNIDYCALQNQADGETYFYAITDDCVPLDQCGETWSIPLAIDNVMTAAYRLNGIQNLVILDGITERHHVPKSSDTYGAYIEEDPMLVPSKPLEVFAEELFTPTPGAGQHHFIDSTLSLDNMGRNANVVTYGTVDVPQPVSVQNNTQVSIDNVGLCNTPGTEYYDGENATVQEGIARARGLGTEGGILNSWSLPDDDYNAAPTQDGVVLGMNGVDEEESTNSISFEHSNVQNKRVIYGSLNKIMLVSPACGTKMEFNPEDLAFKNGVLQQHVTVRKITDPRPNGRPYFIPTNYRESTHTFDSALPGMEWANAPLVYTGRSGSTLDEIRYNNRRRMIDTAYEGGKIRNIQNLSPIGSSAANLANGFEYSQNAGAPIRYTSTYGQYQGAFHGPNNPKTHTFIAGYEDGGWSAKFPGVNKANVAGLAVNMVNGVANYYQGRTELDAQYNAQAIAEIEDLMLGMTVVAPELHFPRSETVRDFIGNNVIVAQYRPRNEDIHKLDKILTMYGYRDTKALESSDFTNRSKFNYVKVHGLQVGGDLPLWLRTGLAMQLSNGCRIWHQLPDPAVYTDGSNV